jgi:hypothetical protein
MKKVILLFAFVLGNFFFVFAQTKKTNVSDTIPYHFSLKHDWALKLNALQPFVVGEFRFGLEKRITKHDGLDLIASFYVPSLQLFHYSEKGRSFAGQYSGNRNYKLGIGYLNWFGTNNQAYFELLAFYHCYEDYYYNLNDDVYPYLFDGKVNYTLQINHRIFSTQLLVGNRIKTNRFFLDYYFGFGLRTIYIKTSEIPDSKTFLPIIRPWESDGINVKLLYQHIKSQIFPTIQFGVNIGLRTN